jgi:hypothetical protein
MPIIWPPTLGREGALPFLFCRVAFFDCLCSRSISDLIHLLFSAARDRLSPCTSEVLSQRLPPTKKWGAQEKLRERDIMGILLSD